MNANKKRILNIILLINIILLLIAVSYVDYIVIIESLDYEAIRASKIFGIEITNPIYIPIDINRVFEALGHQIYDILKINYGDLKGPHNAYLMDELVKIWHRLNYNYMHIAYSTKYTKYLFFIFNYLNYKLSLATVYFIIKILCLSLICIIFYKKYYL